MRAVKPIRLGMLHRTLELGQKPHIIVTVLAMTPFSGEKDVLGEIAMWKLVEKSVAGGILDEGFSKPAGEVIVFGHFHALEGKAVPVSFVGLEVSRGTSKLIEKRLAIFGDRVWKNGIPTVPEPILSCPIDWSRAFGGEDFALNPIGRGTKPKSSDVPWAMPNIEDREDMIKDPSDKPRPAGFGPLDLTSPARRALAGTYTGDYLTTRFPGPASDMDPAFFHSALEDQRIKGFFLGGETIVVQNMHPEKSRLEGKITSFRARAFLERQARGVVDPVFEEVPLRMDTAILFPGQEAIVSVFRGMVPVAEDDSSDVLALVIGGEDASMPREPAHYHRVLRARTDRDKHGPLMSLKDEDLMPQREAGWGNPRMADEMMEMTKLDGLLEKRMGAQGERIRKEKREELRAMGLEPDDFLPEPKLEDAPPNLDDFDAIADYADKMIARADQEKEALEKRKAELEARAREEAAKAGMDWDAEVAKALKELAGPPKFRAKKELEKLRSACELARNAELPLLELEEQIADPGFMKVLEEREKLLMEGYRVGAAFKAPASKLDAEASLAVRERLAVARERGEAPEDLDFTGADLSGLNLSGMLLDGALLECADLSGANLDGAKLTRAVLSRAKLTGASFVGADLSDANLGDTTFDGADFSRAKLKAAFILRARLDEARFAGADFQNAILLESTFGKVDFGESNLDSVAFYKADLREATFARAKLKKAQFIECNLSGCDLEGAILDGSLWVDTTLDGARLTGASMKQCAWARGISFVKGDLRDAIVERSCLRGANLRGANLTRATLSGSDISEADLTEAILTESTARGAMFIRANFTRANARGANFMEAILKNAILAGADFSKANLFRAMLSRARGDDKTRFTGANVDFVLKEPTYKEPPVG